VVLPVVRVLMSINIYRFRRSFNKANNEAFMCLKLGAKLSYSAILAN